jgi:hypothetical protein
MSLVRRDYAAFNSGYFDTLRGMWHTKGHSPVVVARRALSG